MHQLDVVVDDLGALDAQRGSGSCWCDASTVRTRQPYGRLRLINRAHGLAPEDLRPFPCRGWVRTLDVRRFCDGSVESAGQPVPPRRGRRHPHAHRVVRGVRATGAAVRGGRRPDRQQVAAAAPVSPEGALRAGSPRPAGVGRRPALQPRLPRPPLGAPSAGRRGGARQPDGTADGRRARSAPPAVGGVDDRGSRAVVGGR